MEISSLIPMVGYGPNSELVHSLNRINSHVLTVQQRNFPQALGPKGNTEVFCFYETEMSPTAKKVFPRRNVSLVTYLANINSRRTASGA